MKKRFLVVLAAGFVCLLTACAGTGELLAFESEKTAVSSDSGVFMENDATVPVQVGIDAETDESSIHQYELVAQNNRLAMYADLSTGLFAVKNKKTSKIWYSTPRDTLLDTKTKGKARLNMQSQILLGFIYREDENTNVLVQTANSQISCINEGTVTVTKLENGIHVVYDFAELGIVVPVNYTIRADYIQADIEMDAVQEGDRCLLIFIHLLPMMGAGNWEETGQLFVPDGCGALVDFNNNISMAENYQSMVYGEDLGVNVNMRKTRSETIRLPVFGTLIEGDALMGVITKGDGSAAIYVYNGNRATSYNAVSSKAVIRNTSVLESFYMTNKQKTILKVSHTPYAATSYEVRYYVLDGKRATVEGMAGCYREYLMAEKGLKVGKINPALVLDVYGSVDIKANLLGFSYDKKTSLTTFGQTEDILEKLRNDGVKNLAVRYIGWGNDGTLNRSLPRKAKVLGNLGGRNALSGLVTYCADNGIALYPEIDLLRFRSGSDAVRTPSGNNAQVYEYMLSVNEIDLNETPLKLTRQVNLPALADDFGSSYTGVGSSRLSLAGLAGLMYSDFSQHGGVHRVLTPRYFEEVMKKLQERELGLSVQKGNAYAIPYVERIGDTPIYSSGYDIFSSDVPFYQMVLHGVVNLTLPSMMQSIDPSYTYLKAFETGSDLDYACIHESSDQLAYSRYNTLYSATFDLWKVDAAAKYGELYAFLDQVCDSRIVEHEQLGKNVYRTTFENGVRATVNYGDQDYEHEGCTVGSKDYLIEEG